MRVGRSKGYQESFVGRMLGYLGKKESGIKEYEEMLPGSVVPILTTFTLLRSYFQRR